MVNTIGITLRKVRILCRKIVPRDSTRWQASPALSSLVHKALISYGRVQGMRSINKLAIYGPIYSPIGCYFQPPPSLDDLQPSIKKRTSPGKLGPSSGLGYGGQRDLGASQVPEKYWRVLVFNGQYQFQQPYVLLSETGNTYMFVDAKANVLHTNAYSTT